MAGYYNRRQKLIEIYTEWWQKFQTFKIISLQPSNEFSQNKGQIASQTLLNLSMREKIQGNLKF